MKSRRVDILDAWRTLALVLMMVYHFLYDLAIFGVITWQQLFSPGLNLLQKFICCSFIFLAGISACFSRSNLRHGLVVLAAHVAVVIGAEVGGETIRFGILAFMGTAMILYHFAAPLLRRLPGWLLATLSLALFFWSDSWTCQVPVKFLYPLGFTYPGFTSSDYFPLLPWLFLFLLGTAAGGWVLQQRERLGALRLPGALTWPGRHSLLLYLLHQPVLYGISWLVWG